MANTIKVRNQFQFLRDSVLRQNFPTKDTSITTTSELCVMTQQIVGTTHEVLAAGDVTDTAMMIVENLHATATVSVGSDSGGSFVKWFDIAAGDPPAVLPRVGALASTYLKSSTASTPVGITLAKIS